MAILFHEKGNAEGKINCSGIKSTVLLVLLVQFKMPVIHQMEISRACESGA